MSLYTYQALDQSGKPADGQMEAASMNAAVNQLRARALYVLEIVPGVGGEAGGSASALGRNSSLISLWRRFLGKYQPISLGTQMFLFRQLAVMLRSGLPLLEAIEACRSQSNHYRLRRYLTLVIEGIRSGKRFSQALTAMSDVFSITTIRLIESGEASGELDHVLEQIASHLETKAGLHAKLITSLSYPVVVVVAAFGVAAFLTCSVIPKLAKQLTRRSAELPKATEMLMDLSFFVQGYGWLFLVVGLALTALLVFVWSKPAGKLSLSRKANRTPILGKVLEVASMAQLGKTLSLLLSSGLNLTEALQVAAAAVGNPAYQDGLSRSITAILKGRSLSESLSDADFPQLVKQMTSVGERTGELTLAFEEMGRYYERELQTQIQRMTAMIEPVTLVGIGGMVGFVYFAFFTALFSMANPG